MTTGHTPTPWEQVGQHISDGDCGEIASTSDSNFEYDVDLANAAHIVKCVNLHPELIEALRFARCKFMNDYHNRYNEAPLSTPYDEVLKKAGAL